MLGSLEDYLVSGDAMFSGCELFVSNKMRRPLSVSPCDSMRQEEKHVYLVMECCEGGDIGERAGCPRCTRCMKM